MSNNAHIRAYLSYYATLTQEPRYAVMISGRWGTGKTHMVRALLNDIETPDLKTVYISLNGLKTFQDIDRELLRGMYGILGNNYARTAIDLGKLGLKWWRGTSLDINVLDLFNRYAANLYVFDDLERCGMPPVQALGYINAFVEHGGRKVIIIANEDEIDEPAYGHIREKIIGQTLAFESAIDEALDTFISEIRNLPAQKFLAGKIEVIKAIDEQGGLTNLRVLQKALWDFVRFYEVLDERHHSHEPAMTAMLRLLLALSMEVRGGRIKEGDLRDRQMAVAEAVMARMPRPSASAFLEARHRYPGADLESSALSDDTLIALLIKGVVDGDAIRRDLNASIYFVVVANEQPWRTLWNGLERTNDEVATALAQVEAQFAARAFTVPGEILHVFGLRLKFSDIGELPIALPDVVASCERYVDALYTEGKLEPASPGGGPSAMRESGYGGLQIAESDTPAYQGLFVYLENKRAQAAADTYPAKAAELLVMLQTDPDRFIGAISSNRGSESRLDRIPVLARMPHDAVVTTLLGLRPDLQRAVLDALGARYEHRMFQRELAPELEWARAVRDGLAAATPAMSPYGRHRMDRYLQHSLDQIPELTRPAPNPAPLIAPAGPP